MQIYIEDTLIAVRRWSIGIGRVGGFQSAFRVHGEGDEARDGLSLSLSRDGFLTIQLG